MATNLRARDPIVREAQAAAQAGDVRKALRHLKSHTVEAKGDGALVAAEIWLALDKETRARTSIYASGRAIRSAVNAAVQQGLLANREIGPGKMKLDVLDRVNPTWEELRHLPAYRAGRVLEVSRKQQALGLSVGEYRVLGQDRNGRLVEVEDKRGKRFRFDPARIKAGKGEDNLILLDPRNDQRITIAISAYLSHSAAVWLPVITSTARPPAATTGGAAGISSKRVLTPRRSSICLINAALRPMLAVSDATLGSESRLTYSVMISCSCVWR